MLGQMELRGVRPRDGRHCELCGSSLPAVRCDKCGSQIFCLSCDDMYHRHPKRRFHLRKAVDPQPLSAQARPVLPVKASQVAPGDPSKMPLPPPRKKKSTRSFFDTFRRGSPSSENSPTLPKKEYNWTDRLGSIKNFMSSRPLPPLPNGNSNGQEVLAPPSDPQVKHDMSFLHKRNDERPPQLPQRSTKPHMNPPLPEKNFMHSGGHHVNGGAPSSVFSAHNSAQHQRFGFGMDIDKNGEIEDRVDSPKYKTINRHPSYHGQVPPGAFFPDTPVNMHQSASTTDLHKLPPDQVPLPHPYPHYPMHPQYPYPMYPQYPNYPQYFGNSWANLPQTTDADVIEGVESKQHPGKRFHFRKRAKRSQSVMMDRMNYPGQFFPFVPFPTGYAPPGWAPPHLMDTPSSQSGSTRSLNRVGRSRHGRRKTSSDEEDDDYVEDEFSPSSSPVSRNKSSSSDRRRAERKLDRTGEDSSSEEQEQKPTNRKSKRRASDERGATSPAPKVNSSDQKPNSKIKRRDSVEAEAATTELRNPEEVKDDISTPRLINSESNKGEDTNEPWIPTTDWQCPHCTYINNPNARICQVCCKTATRSLEGQKETQDGGGPSLSVPEENNRKISESSEISCSSPEKATSGQQSGRSSKADRRDMAILNSALDEAEKEISRGLEELMKLKDDFSTETQSPSSQERNTNTSPKQDSNPPEPQQQQPPKPVYKSSGKLRSNLLDKLTAATKTITTSTSTETQTLDNGENEQKQRRPSTSSTTSDVYNSPTAQSPEVPRRDSFNDVRRDSSSQTKQNSLMEYLQRKKAEEESGYMGRNSYDMNAHPMGRFEGAVSPFMYEDRGYAPRMMQRSHSRASLFAARYNDPMDYGDRGYGLPSMYRSVSRGSLSGDFPEGRYAEFSNLRKPDYYLSMEELVERRRQDSVRAQGLELVRMIREAEQQGFTADDIQVALHNCGKQNPVDWLQGHWREMVDGVVNLATNYGADKRQDNDIGLVAEAEARDALRLHRGNIWAAVTECVEGRQRKFLELSARGKFSRRKIVDALSSSQGDVEAAYALLTKSSSKPFLMRIWGAGEGAQNQAGALPRDDFKFGSDTYRQGTEKFDAGEESEELWLAEEEEEEEEEYNQWSEEDVNVKATMDVQESTSIIEDVKTPESEEISEYCDAFGSGGDERNLSSPSSDDLFIAIQEQQKQKRKGPSFLSKLSGLRKENKQKQSAERSIEGHGKDIEAGPSKNDFMGDNLDQEKSYGPLDLLKNTLSAIKDTVTGSSSKSEKLMIPDKRTIVVSGNLPSKASIKEEDTKLISMRVFDPDEFYQQNIKEEKDEVDDGGTNGLNVEIDDEGIDNMDKEILSQSYGTNEQQFNLDRIGDLNLSLNETKTSVEVIKQNNIDELSFTKDELSFTKDELSPKSVDVIKDQRLEELSGIDTKLIKDKHEDNLNGKEDRKDQTKVNKIIDDGDKLKKSNVFDINEQKIAELADMNAKIIVAEATAENVGKMLASSRDVQNVLIDDELISEPSIQSVSNIKGPKNALDSDVASNSDNKINLFDTQNNDATEKSARSLKDMKSHLDFADNGDNIDPTLQRKDYTSTASLSEEQNKDQIANSSNTNHDLQTSDEKLLENTERSSYTVLESVLNCEPIQARKSELSPEVKTSFQSEVSEEINSKKYHPESGLTETSVLLEAVAASESDVSDQNGQHSMSSKNVAPVAIREISLEEFEVEEGNKISMENNEANLNLAKVKDQKKMKSVNNLNLSSALQDIQYVDEEISDNEQVKNVATIEDISTEADSGSKDISSLESVNDLSKTVSEKSEDVSKYSEIGNKSSEDSLNMVIENAEKSSEKFKEDNVTSSNEHEIVDLSVKDNAISLESEQNNQIISSKKPHLDKFLATEGSSRVGESSAVPNASRICGKTPQVSTVEEKIAIPQVSTVEEKIAIPQVSTVEEKIAIPQVSTVEEKIGISQTNLDSSKTGNKVKIKSSKIKSLQSKLFKPDSSEGSTKLDTFESKFNSKKQSVNNTAKPKDVSSEQTGSKTIESASSSTLDTSYNSEQQKELEKKYSETEHTQTSSETKSISITSTAEDTVSTSSSSSTNQISSEEVKNETRSSEISLNDNKEHTTLKSDYNIVNDPPVEPTVDIQKEIIDESRDPKDIPHTSSQNILPHSSFSGIADNETTRQIYSHASIETQQDTISITKETANERTLNSEQPTENSNDPSSQPSNSTTEAIASESSLKSVDNLTNSPQSVVNGDSKSTAIPTNSLTKSPRQDMVRAQNSEESDDSSLSITPPSHAEVLRFRVEGLREGSPMRSMSPVRPQSPYGRLSFKARKEAIALEKQREMQNAAVEKKPWFLQKVAPEPVKVTLPKRSIKQQLEMERRVRKMVSDRKCRTYRKAEIVVQLMDMNFEETESLHAANECSTLEQAISYLQQECLLCMGYYSVSQIISMVHCPHKACRDCIRAYFTVQIRDRTIMELLCPFCNEPDIHDEDVAQDYFNHLDIMLKKLVEYDIHELFQRKLRDRVLMKDPNFRWCSQCSSGFISMPNLKRLVCPDCNAVTCASCRRPWEREHQGISCEAFAALKDATDPEAHAAGLAKLLTEDGIDCPSCHFRYSLAKGGCMHFRCIQCMHDFCSGCSRPFKMGQKCGVSEFCGKLGLHAHHPRNCLFYLRDKEPNDLQRLLEMNEVEYDEDLPEGMEVTTTCQVLEQKETTEGMVDDVCGKEVQEGYAGLCRVHYVEYLGQLVNKHKVDPIQIFENDDLELVLKRASIRLPPKRYRESDDEYREKLVQLIEDELPLDKMDGS